MIIETVSEKGGGGEKKEKRKKRKTKRRNERKEERRAWNRNKTNEVKAIEVGNWSKRRPIPFLE